MSATPLLDLEQAAPAAPRRRRGLGIYTGVAVGLAWIALDILQDRGILPAWRLPENNIWLLLPIAYVAIAIHELGHAAAGWLAGLGMGGISVGPLLWQKSGSRWVFRWMWRLWGGGMFKPLTAAAGLDPRPFAWSVAGGPIASLGLTALAVLLWVRYGDGGWSWIGTLILASLLTLALSIIPWSFGLQKTDGARLWQFLRHPDQARQVMGLLGVQSEEAKGVRPRDWSPALFDAMMLVDRSSATWSWCNLMASYRGFDAGAGDKALEYLERALAESGRAGKPMRHALFLEAACSSAVWRKDAGHAREWLRRACKEHKPRSTEAAEAAIAMREERYDDAIAHWERARAYVDKLRLDSGLIRFAKEKWTDLAAECLAAEERKEKALR
ncbi:MAG TPA: hypothetical protein VG297_08235 [Bryobacteraceae bacterium]|nr:hypothetical protein [Bryobacteraceae bacterium]